MSARILDCALADGRLRILLRLPAGSDAAAVAARLAIEDAFGRPLRLVSVTPRPDAPDHVAVEADLPALEPGADPPACLLTIPDGDGLARIALAPDRPAIRPPSARAAPAPPPGGITIDYTARDYDALCAMMKARIAEHVGGDAAATLAHAADPLVTLVEALAYLGDQAAFRQDAAGTEAYLPTARSRVSLRRHARLRDHAADDGACARTLLAFAVEGDGVLPAGLAAVTAQPGRPRTVLDPGPPLAAETTVFELCEPLAVGAALNDLGPALMRDTAYRLPAGTCAATLAGPWPSLSPGKLLVLRQRAAPSGAGRPFGAQALRLIAVRPDPGGGGAEPATAIRWHPEDALRDALAVPASGEPGAVELLGNVALADHGRTLPDALPLEPDRVPERGGYRPRIAVPDPVYACPVPQVAIPAGLGPCEAGLLLASAAALLDPDPRDAVAALAVREVPEAADGDRPPPPTWRPARDLLSAPATARLFSAAPERQPGSGTGGIVLGFGDGSLGRRPAPGTRFEALARTGDGVNGQCDADALRQVLGEIGGPASLVLAVTNPLPAAPGLPETDAAIRLLAATGYHAQERGITREDWTRLARRDPLVADAVAAETDGAGPCTIGLDLTYPDEAGLALAEARLLDYAVLGAEPTFLPVGDAFLDAALVAYCRPGADIGAVRWRLARAFGPGRRPDGTPAFLDPGLWPPGRDAALSAFVAEVARDPDIAQVVSDAAADPRVRFGLTDDAAGLVRDRIVLGPGRRLRAGNDPLRPEAGRFVLYLAASP